MFKQWECMFSPRALIRGNLTGVKIAGEIVSTVKIIRLFFMWITLCWQDHVIQYGGRDIARILVISRVNKFAMTHWF